MAKGKNLTAQYGRQDLVRSLQPLLLRLKKRQH